MAIRLLSWNLFHGRDFPPDRALLTWRSRLLRTSERNATHIQVNRDLEREFADLLAGAEWDIALLQECPPRWSKPLAEACAAEPHRVLTARNSWSAVRTALARLNPDLIASNEGGSNLTLVRSSAGVIAERIERVLEPRPRRPERRTMALTRIAGPGARELWVANLHASAGRKNRALAERQVLGAAAAAIGKAGDAPLVFGGDLNLRPRESSVFAGLEARFGLVGPTAPDSLDHLLARGLEPSVPASAWPPERREVVEDGLRLRLSDHAPVEATFR